MRDPGDTLPPEETPTDPDMVSVEALLAGLGEREPENWDGFASEELDET